MYKDIPRGRYNFLCMISVILLFINILMGTVVCCQLERWMLFRHSVI